MLDQIARLRRHPVSVVPLPFYVAANGIGKRNRHGFPGQMFLWSAIQIVRLRLLWLSRIVGARPV